MTRSKAIVGGSIAATCAGLLACTDSEPADFSEQFITLPSGYQAYCNRQGYREISTTRGNVLVEDTGGNFVPCDPRVGPPWDAMRTDENGNSLTSQQIAKINADRLQEKNRLAQQERQRKLEEKKAKGRAFVENEYEENMARCRIAQTGELVDMDWATNDVSIDAYRKNCADWHRQRYKIDMARAEAGWLCDRGECDDQ